MESRVQVKITREQERLEIIAAHFAEPLADMEREYIARAQELRRGQSVKERGRAHSFEEGVLFVLLHRISGRSQRDGYPESAYVFCDDFCRPELFENSDTTLGMLKEEAKQAFLHIAYRRLLNASVATT